MNEETTMQTADQAEAGGGTAAEATVGGQARPAAERRTTLPTRSVSEGADGTRSVPATEPLAEPTREAGAPDYVDRIRQHPELTPAMRQRLAELVQRQPPDEGPPQLPLDDVLAILAETVPSSLRLDAGELPIAPHPEGEAFFTGDGAADADKHAAAVASEQLALSGLLRKP